MTEPVRLPPGLAARALRGAAWGAAACSLLVLAACGRPDEGRALGQRTEPARSGASESRPQGGQAARDVAQEAR